MPIALPDFTGTMIDAGRLELLQYVGAGACAEVYLAIDHEASASSLVPVRRAVKIVPKAGLSKRDTQRQRQEIANQRLVSDVPGVLELLDAIEDDAHFYLVTDYRDCDLLDLILEGVSFERKDERIRSVFVQILGAVQGCHQKGMYHCALTPENILCTADGNEVVLADFGMATPQAQSHSRGYSRRYGRRSYLSPATEFVNSTTEPYSTEHADIWALGRILVDLITGCRYPWSKASIDDPDFRQFVFEDQWYLQREFGISRGAADLLKRVFRLHPVVRPSLAQIRKDVLRLDTFFAEFEEDSEWDEPFDSTPTSEDSVAVVETPGNETAFAPRVVVPKGYVRPLLPALTRTASDDEFALSFLDGLEMLIAPVST
ncbi:kinase-like domain-containing protein [Rhodofomes roseus]|uniref:Kinase-like domain-containing protein n=1 Tax=Rhodofomes roseus TaxID=34475 RepID=A0ABQ8K121_9APHY|nr:kinase-like domain-containing protein [Rhodofomes roseus]KAH9830320.1 kinase-like domain-containing protein [Rhodofomes roseus]